MGETACSVAGFARYGASAEVYSWKLIWNNWILTTECRHIFPPFSTRAHCCNTHSELTFMICDYCLFVHCRSGRVSCRSNFVSHVLSAFRREREWFSWTHYTTDNVPVLLTVSAVNVTREATAAWRPLLACVRRLILINVHLLYHSLSRAATLITSPTCESTDGWQPTAIFRLFHEICIRGSLLLWA